MEDPYHDNKIYHLAKMIRGRDGAVSPLCAEAPRKLDVSKETWTIRHKAVTCPKCLAKIKKAEAKKQEEPRRG